MIENKEIKMIVSDLDGTLLNPSYQIDDATKAIFKQLHQQNYKVVIATGRHHLDAMGITKKLDIPVYLVTSNGARLHSPEGDLIFSYDIDSETIKSVLNLDIDPEITTVLFKEKVWLTNKENQTLNSFQEKMYYPPQIVNFSEISNLSAIKLLFTHNNHEKLVDLKHKILNNTSKKLTPAFSLPICLEWMHESVDKSIAIAKILEREKTSFKNTIIFGDGFNDQKMLEFAGKGLIMGNAPNDLKQKLSHLEVIESNAENGVAKYLKKLINSTS